MGHENVLKGSGPLIGMILAQMIAMGLQILSRIILSEGTFIFALIAYRHTFAALCIAPFAFFLERGKGSKVTLMVVFWVFMSSLTGMVMGMGMFNYGLRDTTATYATNFLNVIPIVTFLFSTILGIERLNLRTRSGQVRIVGAFISVSGALVFCLYKGKTLVIGHRQTNHHTWLSVKKSQPHWTRGTILLVGGSMSVATWYIVQVKLLKLFPFKYWTTLLTCISAAVQTTVIGLCLDRSKSSWKLGWNLELITIVYSGILGSGLMLFLISWAVSSKGPTYPAMFGPLALVFVAVVEVFFLGEDLKIGSVIGMVVILVGLYLFLWATSRDIKANALPMSGTSFDLGENKPATTTATPTTTPTK